MDQFDQPRSPGPARKRVRLYVERFLALAREGSQGEDDENAPRIDVLDHVTLDVRDLRVLAEEPDRAELDAARAEHRNALDLIAALERNLNAAGARVAELEVVADAARTLADEPDRSQFEQHLAVLEERVAALDATTTPKVDPDV